MAGETGTMLPLLQTLAGGLLAIGGGVVTQLWTSRRDYGKRRIDLAEELLAHFYEARDAIEYIRNPMSWGGEGSTRSRGEHELPEDSEILDKAYIAVERYKKHETTFNSLRAKKFRFMATFRGSAHEPFQEINTALNQVFAASHILGTHYWRRQSRIGLMPEELERHTKETLEQSAVFWRVSDVDKITTIVDAAIGKVEAIADMAAQEYAGPPKSWQRLMVRGKQSPGR